MPSVGRVCLQLAVYMPSVGCVYALGGLCVPSVGCTCAFALSEIGNVCQFSSGVLRWMCMLCMLVLSLCSAFGRYSGVHVQIWWTCQCAALAACVCS